jgi:hypothetical protein
MVNGKWQMVNLSVLHKKVGSLIELPTAYCLLLLPTAYRGYAAFCSSPTG